MYLIIIIIYKYINISTLCEQYLTIQMNFKSIKTTMYKNIHQGLKLEKIII